MDANDGGRSAGIAAANLGARGFALMGISAARLHHVVPRAVSVAVVAAPRRRRSIELTDRDAAVRFLVRDLDVMQLEIMQTELGACLVTTPELTVLDLAHRPDQHGLAGEVDGALRALAPRCDVELLTEIAMTQRRGRALNRVHKPGLLP